MIISYLSVCLSGSLSARLSSFHIFNIYPKPLVQTNQTLQNNAKRSAFGVNLDTVISRHIKMYTRYDFVFKFDLTFFFIQSYQYSWLVVWGFPSHSRIFLSFEDVTIAGEGLQILTYVQHICHRAVSVLWRATSRGIRVQW